MKKVFALFFALLFCLMSVLSSCNKNGEDTPAPSADYLELIPAGGASSLTVIYPDSGEDSFRDIALDLQEKMNAAYTVQIGIVKDSVKPGEDPAYPSNTCEILLGTTNRAETAEALKQIDAEEYILTAVGNKLIIAGHNAYATAKALDAFARLYLSGEKKDTPLRYYYNRTKIGTAGVDQAVLTKGADLRILTLNINCSDNDAPKRYQHILNVVENYHPEILCLQECNKEQHANVVSKLGEKYGLATTYHENGSTFVYTPILYLKSKYELVDEGVSWLRDRYTGTNTKSIAFAVLKVKKTGKIFGVINLHGAICSNSYTGYENLSKSELNAQSNAWREGNVRQIIELQTDLEQKHGQIPILHTADYNFNSASTPYRMMIEFGLTEAEVSATGSRVTGIKTTHTVGQKSVEGKSIDHIFYNAERITALTHFIGNEADSDLRASDHLPVFADIKFN